MTIPDYSDLKHDGRPRNNTDWDNILTRTQNYMTDGTADFTLESITATTYNNLPGFSISGKIAGENLTKGQVVRLKQADNKIWKADSSTLLGVTNVLGIVDADYSTGEEVTIEKESYSEYTGLTSGILYYVGTSGAISSTAGTYSFKIGTSISTTTIVLDLSGQEWRNNTLHWEVLTNVIPTRSVSDDPTYEITFASVDLTGKLQDGMKLKLTQDSTVRYFIITKVALDGSDTDVTLYGGSDYNVEDTGVDVISDLYYSSAKAPFGFPLKKSLWTESVSYAGIDSQSTPGTTWYNLGSIVLNMPIGAWNASYDRIVEAIVSATGGTKTVGLTTTLSTANNSESDADMSAAFLDQTVDGTAYTYRRMFSRNKTIEVTTKTPYYLNVQGGADLLSIGGVGTPNSIVKFVCDYL